MTVFGHPVLFDYLENREATASEKAPMQWHRTRTLSLDNTLDVGRVCEGLGAEVLPQKEFMRFLAFIVSRKD